MTNEEGDPGFAEKFKDLKLRAKRIRKTKKDLPSGGPFSVETAFAWFTKSDALHDIENAPSPIPPHLRASRWYHSGRVPKSIGDPHDRGWPSSRRNRSFYFYGTDYWGRALELFENGWRGANRKIIDTSEDLINKRSVDLRAPDLLRVWDVAGCYPSVPRALSGQPECMARYQMERNLRNDRRMIRVFVDSSAPHSVPADSLIIRASVIVSIIGALQRNGYSIELWCGNMAKGPVSRRQGLVEAIRIAEASGHLNIENAAFFLGHPSFLRRIIFATKEVLDQRTAKEVGAGFQYGTPTGETESARLLDTLEDLIGPVDLHVPGWDTKIRSGSDVFLWKNICNNGPSREKFFESVSRHILEGMEGKARSCAT